MTTPFPSAGEVPKLFLPAPGARKTAGKGSTAISHHTNPRTGKSYLTHEIAMVLSRDDATCLHCRLQLQRTSQRRPFSKIWLHACSIYIFSAIESRSGLLHTAGMGSSVGTSMLTALGSSGDQYISFFWLFGAEILMMVGTRRGHGREGRKLAPI